MRSERARLKVLYQIMPGIWGGVESSLFNLISGLDRKKFYPIICSYNHGPALNRFKSLNIPIHIIKKCHPDNPEELVKFLKKNNIDLAHTSNFFPALAVASKISGVFHIWRVGGHVSPSVMPLERRRIILNLMSGLSDRIICTSNFLKRQFDPEIRRKITVIYNGIDHSEIEKIRFDKARLKRFGYKPGEVVVGMVGNLYPQKRHIDFIRAAGIINKKNKNIRFIIAGSKYENPSGEKYYASLEKAIKELKVEKNVIMAGFIRDIMGAMAAMDVIVLPTINEGFGNVIMEAMALGKPVVVSNSGGPSEFVREGVTGFLFPAKNHKALAETILKVLSNPGETEKIARAAKKKSKSIFYLRECVKKYEALYERICSKKLKNQNLYHASCLLPR